MIVARGAVPTNLAKAKVGVVVWVGPFGQSGKFNDCKMLGVFCTRPRVQRASGFPCALFFFEGENRRKARAHGAARVRSHVY